MMGTTKIFEQEKLEIPIYLVAWVDLLGQGRLLEGIPLFPKSEEELRQLRGPFENIYKFRKSLQDIHQKLTRPFNPQSLPSQELTPEQDKILKRFRETKVALEFIGDAALLNVALADGDRHSPIKCIASVLSQISIMMISSLAEERPLRSAIDLGRCLDLGQNSIYGQAVAGAYRLETKVSDYPRVSIGKRLIQYLNIAKQGLANPVGDKIKEVENILLTSIWNSIRRDVDGIYILNYLKHIDDLTEKGDVDTKTLASKACNFITKSIQKAESSCDVKLFKRYWHLRSYFVSEGYWM